LGFKDKLRRLERCAEEDKILLPKEDSTVAKFPQPTAADALVNYFDRLGAGEDAPPEHPLTEAARNSSDPWWRGSIYAADEDVTAPIPDLSES
jgi:hypothetical protein